MTDGPNPFPHGLPLVELNHRPGDDGLLVRHVDGRVFVALSERIRQFSQQGDSHALLACNRAWQSNQGLFNEVHKPEGERASDPALVAPAGFAAQLTLADRRRLRAIVRKNHRLYFADHPTDAQCDNLIDGFGPEVARKIVLAAVGKGLIH